MSERWLPVSGYPDYEVSDQGRVRSLDRQVRSRWGTPKTLKGKLLAQTLMGNDIARYPACGLYQDGHRRTVTIHTLVLETFVGPRPDGMWGYHRDDNTLNNDLQNLYWGNPRNVQNSYSGRHVSTRSFTKTHCPHGHEYTSANTHIRRTGYRSCRTCHRHRAKMAYRRKHGLA